MNDENGEFSEISIEVGSWVVRQDGHVRDDRRSVRFVGKALAHVELGDDGRVGRAGNCGTTQTLYQLPDGRLVVHSHYRTAWVGEPNTDRLVVVTEEDLGPTGRYRWLGARAGYDRDLTVDEALDLPPGGMPPRPAPEEDFVP